MKPCAKCRAELPDTAGHCIYCGTSQAAANPVQSTMMGHPGLGKELADRIQQPAPQYGAPDAVQQQYGAPPQQHGAPQQQQQHGTPQQQQQYGAPPQQQQYAPPQQQQYAPPQQQQYAPPQQNALGAQQQHGAPQQQYPTPGAHAPQHGAPAQPFQGQAPFGGANFGIQDAQFGAAAAAQSPYGSSYRDALTEQVKPLRAPIRDGDSEKWNEALTTQMLVFGVLLVACFVAPWSVGGGKTLFSWSIFATEGVPWAQKLEPILLAATGIIAVVFGALKLSITTRAFAATALGLAPIVFLIINQGSFAWQTIVGALASVLLITGLILRSRHIESKLARILATVGVLGILALYLVPSHGHMLVKALFQQVSDVPGKGKLLVLVGSSTTGIHVGVLPLLLSIGALSVWLRSGRGGAHILVWVLLVWALVVSLTALLLGPEIFETLKAGLKVIFYMPLASIAWMSLACFGIAGVIGNQIDP